MNKEEDKDLGDINILFGFVASPSSALTPSQESKKRKIIDDQSGKNLLWISMGSKTWTIDVFILCK